MSLPGGLFEQLNAGQLTGNLTINIISDLVETGIVALNKWVSDAGGPYTITINPSGARTINFASNGIRLSGPDGITIDGLNDGNNSLTILGGIKFYFGASNNTFTRLTLSGSGFDSSDASGTFPVNCSNNTISECVIDGGGKGIYFGSWVSASGTNNSIINNVIKNFGQYGIQLDRGYSDFTISGNDIYQTSGSGYSVGIYANAATSVGTVDIFNNKIHDLTSGTSLGNSTSGIFYSASGTYNIYNNEISLEATTTNTQADKIYGILSGSYGASNIYYNSIYIGGTGVTKGNSVGFYRTNGTVNFKNNAVYNARSGAAISQYYKNFGVVTANLTGFVSDNNLIYADGTSSVLFNIGGQPGYAAGTDYTTLAAWQTVSSQDLNSVSVDPGFTSPTNLLPTNSALNAGIPIAGITTDITGLMRDATTPTMGAYEIPCTNPISAGSIAAPATTTGCDPFDPAVITSAGLPSGHSGTLEYQWQQSTTGEMGAYTAVSGASNSESYDPGPISVTTWFKRLARVDCKGTWVGAVESNVVEMTVNPVPEVTTSNMATICNGTSTAIALEATVASNYTWTVGTITNGITGAADASGAIIDQVLTNPGTIAGTVEYIVTPTSVTGTCEGPAYPITVTVNPTIPVSIAIIATANPVCSGNEVQFFATPSSSTNGSPLTYQWKVNGGDVVWPSVNNYTYTPADGDEVTCELTSEVTCPSASPAISNTVVMSVLTDITPTVAISTTATTICDGESLTFNATSTNGGVSPTYQWKVNTQNVGTGITYSYAPINGDVVTCEMLSSITCAATNPVTSNAVPITVNPILTASVTIAADANPVCPGSNVTFTPTPTHGGPAPTYEWYVTPSGGTASLSGSGSTFNYAPADGDAVYAIMTSNATPCLAGSPATSNTVEMTVNPAVLVNVTDPTPVISPATVDITDPSITLGSTADLTFTYWEDEAATITFATPTAANAGTYYIKGTLLSTGCFDIKPVNVIVYELITSNTLDYSNGNSGTICGTASENTGVTITAPSGTVFSMVNFASYGNSTGTCPDFVLGSCNAVLSQSVVEGFLLGKNSARIGATNCNFGDPCSGTAKRLNVLATYIEPVCAGTDAGTITGSTPAGGTGVYTYLWESSTTSPTTGFAAAAGTNDAKDYMPGGLTQTTWFRRTVNSGIVNSTSSVILITVKPAMPVDVTISASSTNVQSGTPVIFTAIPTNEGTSPVYQWMVNDINNGTNSTTFTYSPINGDIVKCELTSSLACTTGNPAISNSITMNVANLITSNTLDYSNGNSGTICGTASENTGVTITAPSGTVFSMVNFASYGNSTGTCPDFVLGSCNAVLSQSVVEGFLLGKNSARIGASNGNFGDPCPGTAKRLNVLATYIEPVCAGTDAGTITGSTPAGGTGVYTYLWESSTTSPTTGFAAAAGTNDAKDYMPGGLTQTTWFRRTVNSGIVNSTSSVILITVKPAMPVDVTISASSTNVQSGTPVIFTAIPTNEGTSPVYQWMVNDINNGTNSTTFTYSPINGDIVKCELTSSLACTTGNPAISNSITMNVANLITSNTLDYSNGNSGTICGTASENTGVTITAPSGTVFSMVNFASYGNSTGTCPDFVLGSCNAVLSQSVVEGFLLGKNSARIGASNGNFGDPCPGTAKRLNVLATYIEPVCAGTDAGTITGSTPAGGNGVYTYLWESSTTSPTTGFAAAAGINDAKDYMPGSLLQTSWFRRTVTSGGTSSTSLVVAISVTECAPPLIAMSKSAEAVTSTFDTPQMELDDLKVYPNPFSDRLRFEFSAPESVNARIDLYDMTGRMVKTIFEQAIEGGVNYNAEFKPEATVSGMYIYRMSMGEKVYNGKVVFRK